MAEWDVEADPKGRPTDRSCEHLDAIKDVQPQSGEKCERCEQEGTSSKTVRYCLTCGEVGCDDESPGQHALKHWHDSGHPVFRSMEPGDRWAWCYEDQLLLEPSS